MRAKKTIILRLALLIGLILAVASAMNICGTSACTEAHEYTLLGIPFAFFGIAFFLAAWFVFELGRFFPIFSVFFMLMIFGAGGAEVAFILIQKYEIKQWCPLCLAVAAAVYFLAFMVSLPRAERLLAELRERKVTMLILGRKMVLVMLAAFFGFGLAYQGAQKSEAVENVPDLFLGNAGSSLEVYIITDWFCPACRKAEAEIERTVPAIKEKARIIFVDLPLHTDSLNYTPYSLSFLVHEKEKYVELRKALMTLTVKTKEPSQEDVQRVISPLKVTYKPLPFLTVSRGMKYYQDVAKGFGVKSTPTVVIRNAKSKKTAQLVGAKNITEANIARSLSEVR